MTNPKSDVFCPNCSAKNKIEQNFCRFCGFNLQETSRSLVRQLAVDRNARRFNQLKLIKRLTDFASVGLVFIVSTGLIFYLYAVLTNMIFSGKRVLLGLMLILMIFQFAGRFYRRMIRGRIGRDEAKTNRLADGEPEAKETAKLLEEKSFTPTVAAATAAAGRASVTENSTELLFAENKTTKLG
ncbi:MAG: zinc ribbon domain-containing protein [Acidobacteriota bacterium]|nr:zinc ribbon domain-containing protein [Acidobacteriota bacterium]